MFSIPELISGAVRSGYDDTIKNNDNSKRKRREKRKKNYSFTSITKGWLFLIVTPNTAKLPLQTYGKTCLLIHENASRVVYVAIAVGGIDTTQRHSTVFLTLMRLSN